MDPYVPPSAEPSKAEFRAPEVRIMRAPWKRMILTRGRRVWLTLALLFAAFYLCRAGLAWLRHEPAEPVWWTGYLVVFNLPLIFMNAQIDDDRRMVERARTNLLSPPIAAGKAWSGAGTRGFLCLSVDELFFLPRNRRMGRQVEIALKKVLNVTPDLGDRLNLMLSDGRVEHFRSNCRDLWQEELERALEKVRAQAA